MNETGQQIERERVWAGYQRMRLRLAETIGRELSRETGLSEADYEILSALIEHGGEPVRAIALRCGLRWEKSRLSHQLRRMEARGLVTRETCAEDSRGSDVRVTQLGRELASKAKPVYEQTVERLFFDVLSEEQLASIEEISRRVLASTGEETHG